LASAVSHGTLSERLMTRIRPLGWVRVALPRSLTQCAAVAALPPLPAMYTVAWRARASISRRAIRSTASRSSALSACVTAAACSATMSRRPSGVITSGEVWLSMLGLKPHRAACRAFGHQHRTQRPSHKVRCWDYDRRR
jgi:hypothetical protein